MTPEQFDTHLKFPLFRAEIEPDLRFFGFDLEEILGRKVDLITKSGLRREIKREVLSEAVYV